MRFQREFRARKRKPRANAPVVLECRRPVSGPPYKLFRAARGPSVILYLAK